MYADFHSGSPANLADYSTPELDRLLEHARATADEAQRIEDYCAVARLINKEATWFWLFQNTYYAVTKASVKGIPKLYSGVINVSDAWLE
jgi:4-phytase/acid phosphatase/peptide/nickel transport system substrate-binding protein